MRHEGLHPDDGVVAPVVRLAELPVLHAGGEQPPRHAAGELLRAGMQRRQARGLRRGLDDAGLGVRFHQPHQRGQALAAHHAVGVEHHHVAVVAAPAAAEVGHVAGLALGAALAPAVVDVYVVADGGAQLVPGGEFGGAQIGVAGVGQHVHVEQPGQPRGGQRFAGGTQPGRDSGHVLVADRHDDGGARTGVDRAVGHRMARQPEAVAAQLHDEAHHGGEESRRHPGEQQREEAHLQHPQRRTGERRLGIDQQRGGAERRQCDQGQQDAPAPDRGLLPGLATALRRPFEPSGQRVAQTTHHATPRHRHHRAAVQRRRTAGGRRGIVGGGGTPGGCERRKRAVLFEAGESKGVGMIHEVLPGVLSFGRTVAHAILSAIPMPPQTSAL